MEALRINQHTLDLVTVTMVSKLLIQKVIHTVIQAKDAAVTAPVITVSLAAVAKSRLVLSTSIIMTPNALVATKVIHIENLLKRPG